MFPFNWKRKRRTGRVLVFVDDKKRKKMMKNISKNKRVFLFFLLFPSNNTCTIDRGGKRVREPNSIPKNKILYYKCLNRTEAMKRKTPTISYLLTVIRQIPQTIHVVVTRKKHIQLETWIKIAKITHRHISIVIMNYVLHTITIHSAAEKSREIVCTGNISFYFKPSKNILTSHNAHMKHTFSITNTVLDLNRTKHTNRCNENRVCTYFFHLLFSKNIPKGFNFVV